jgi:hypothetical protein
MTFSDEQLMAYVDGEASAEARAAIDAARTADVELAARLERYRMQRELLRRSFEDVLNEPIPERLIHAARHAPMGDSNVVGLTRARAPREKTAPARWSWPQWSAMAASLVVGLILGQALLVQRDTRLVVVRDGRLTAVADLSSALTNQASGNAGPISIGLTYRSKSGEYCRTFTSARDMTVAGVACREGDTWNVRVLSEIDGSGDTATGYRMAGAELPPVVLQAVEADIVGEPLDAAAENAARLADWRE